jgi:GT2 family glycosyltransferase
MEHDDYRVIIVDNGSEPEQSRRLRERFGGIANVEIRRNEENLGFTRGVNRELERLLLEGEAQHVALLNNDAVPDEDWLEALENCARNSGAGIIASRIVHYDNHRVLDNAGHILLTTGEILPRGTGEAIEGYDEPASLVGASAGAALLSCDLLREIGIFDPYFVTGYEDAELGLRAFVAGYATSYCPDAIVRHKVSRSVDRIRDFSFAVKLQQDINYTWFKLAPTGLLVATLPLIAIRLAVVLIAALLLGRRRLLKVQWTAFRSTAREYSRLHRARLDAAGLRRISSLALARSQTPFLGVYLDYFHRYFLKNNKTVFER